MEHSHTRTEQAATSTQQNRTGEPEQNVRTDRNTEPPATSTSTARPPRPASSPTFGVTTVGWRPAAVTQRVLTPRREPVEVPLCAQRVWYASSAACAGSRRLSFISQARLR